MSREDCYACGGEGYHEEPSDTFVDDDIIDCAECEGTGGFYLCLSSAEWCQANPLPGREGVDALIRPEYFAVHEVGCPAGPTSTIGSHR